jgi:hypothetical protein
VMSAWILPANQASMVGLSLTAAVQPASAKRWSGPSPMPGPKVGFVDLAEDEGNALAAELIAQGSSVIFRRCDAKDIAPL